MYFNYNTKYTPLPRRGKMRERNDSLKYLYCITILTTQKYTQHWNNSPATPRSLGWLEKTVLSSWQVYKKVTTHLSCTILTLMFSCFPVPSLFLPGLFWAQTPELICILSENKSKGEPYCFRPTWNMASYNLRQSCNQHSLLPTWRTKLSDKCKKERGIIMKSDPYMFNDAHERFLTQKPTHNLPLTAYFLRWYCRAHQWGW